MDKFLSQSEKELIKNTAEQWIEAVGVTCPIRKLQMHATVLKEYIEVQLSK